MQLVMHDYPLTGGRTGLIRSSGSRDMHQAASVRGYIAEKGVTR